MKAAAATWQCCKLSGVDFGSSTGSNNSSSNKRIQRRHQQTSAAGVGPPLLQETLRLALRSINLTDAEAAEVMKAWAASTPPEVVAEFPVAAVRANLDYLVKVVGIRRERLPAVLARAPGLLTISDRNQSAEPVRRELIDILGETETPVVLATCPGLLLQKDNVMAWLQVRFLMLWKLLYRCQAQTAR